MNKYFLLLVIFTLLALPACREHKITKADNKYPPVKIGVIGPLSGPEAALGQSCLEGIKTGFTEAGKLASGQRVELLERDDHSQPLTTLAAFRELATSGVSIMLMLSNSDCLLANHQEISRSAIPTIAVLASHPDIVNIGKNISQIPIDDSLQAEMAALFAMDELLQTHAAVIYDSSRAHYLALAKAFAGKYAALGGEIMELLISGDGDLAPEMLQRLIEKDVRFVYVAVPPTTAAKIAGQLKRVNSPPIIMGSDGLLASVKLQDPGLLKNLEDVYTTDYFGAGIAPTAFGTRIIKRFTAESNSPITIIAGLGAEAAAVATSALNMCGKDNGADCTNTMIHRTGNVEGITGKISIGADGKTERVVLINQIQNGWPQFRLKIH